MESYNTVGKFSDICGMAMCSLAFMTDHPTFKYEETAWVFFLNVSLQINEAQRIDVHSISNCGISI